MDEDQLLRMMKDAVFDSVVECPKCGNRLEPDYDICPECNTKNPLQQMGFI